jgi:proline dehydrogenase
MYHDFDDYVDYLAEQNAVKHFSSYERRLEYSKEALEKLIQNLYGDKVFNITEFEESIRELCYRLDVDMPKGDLPLAYNKLGGV